MYTTLALLIFFLIQAAILLLRLLHLSGLRYLPLSYLTAITSRLMHLRPGLPRAVSLHLLQSFLANRQLRTLMVILIAVLVGAINAELLALAFVGSEATGRGIQGLSSTYYFIVLLSLGLSLYYLLKLSVARRHAWLFQLTDPHTLYWSFKKAMLIFLNLTGIMLCLGLAPFLILTGGVPFALKHVPAGITLWSLIVSWHALSTEYIPFTAVIEQDKILFKRLWLFYLIALYFSACAVSAIIAAMTGRETLWLLPLPLTITRISYYLLHRRQSDRISLREPEYELSDYEVLVGFAAE